MLGSAIVFVFYSLILFLPFLFLPGVFNPYEAPKFVFFAGAVQILAVLCFFRFLKTKRPVLPRVDKLTMLILLFGLVNLTADILGVDPKTSFLGSNFRHQGFVTLLLGIVLFLLLHSFSILSQKALLFFRKSIIISGFLLSAFAVWQGIQLHFFHNAGIPNYNGRIVGTLGNPNSLAGYLAMILPFVFFYPRFYLGKFGKIILIFLILSAVFYTDSKSGFLAAGVVFLVYFISALKTVRAKTLAVLAFILMCFGLLWIFFPKNQIRQQMLLRTEKRCLENWPHEYPLLVTSFGRNSFCDSRVLVWIFGLESLSKRPFLGYGQENFGLVIPAGKMYRADSAHNIFLDTAVSSGVLGLFLYLSILYYALRKSALDIRMALIAFIIAGQFNPLSIAQIGLFWILIAFSGKTGKPKGINLEMEEKPSRDMRFG